MRTYVSAAVVLALVLGTFVGPVSAATNPPTIIAQAASTQAQTTGTISGLVVDDQGRPIASAAITLQGQGQTLSATSDGNGAFTFTVAPGVYAVVASRGGFQGAQTTDIAVTGGASTSVRVQMTDASSSSLRVIGRTSSSAQRQQINTSVTAVSTLGNDSIVAREQPNLSNVVGELPGVNLTRGTGSTPNTNFAVRGFTFESRVNIDGHPVSSGSFGAYNTNYTASGLFQRVEVLKGAGLNGPTAGESGVGTINLQTLDFTPKSSAFLLGGIDSYNGSFYNVHASVNFGPKDRASVLVGKYYSGYNGPFDGGFQDRIGFNQSLTPAGTGQVPNVLGLTQWIGDFSNRYGLESELAKFRYKFSDSTSVTLQYLGLQGQYQPQGGSYGTYLGKTTLQACTSSTGAAVATLAGCDQFSTYNAPYAFGQIGSTVDGYTWFPNSVLQNNEPYFSAEFRTAFKNDTILVRPYTALINRFISGAYENNYPGNGGGWNLITDSSNCQVTYVAPNAAKGTVAKGPCFGQNAGYVDPAYVGGDTTARTFATTGTNPCTPTSPCYTTPTAVENDGRTGFGGPFSQPEVDRLHGLTFQYIHPVGDNVYSFSYDFNSDNTTSFTGDRTTPVAAGTPNNPSAGCQLTIGSVANTLAAAGPLGFQPNCGLAFTPRSSINIPSTTIQKNDFALTGQFALTPQLQFDFGNYLTLYKSTALIEDPKLVAALGNQTLPNGTIVSASGAAPVSLVPVTTQLSHYDPHFGFTYRANQDLILRATAGSSITTPYAQQISGFGSVSLPNPANLNYVFSIPNAALKPESTVSYNVGGDLRLPDGGIFSVDGYVVNIYNTFISNSVVIPTPANITLTGGGLALQSQITNGPNQRSFGIETSFQRQPRVGIGYAFNQSLQKTYEFNLPPSFYLGGQSTVLNGAQLLGIPWYKAYGELRYAGEHEFLATFGTEFQGANNATNGPAYFLSNATLRFGVAHNTSLQIAAENLFNYNAGNALARALGNQGNTQPTFGQIRNTTPGTFGFGASRNTNIQALPFRDFRISLQTHF